MKANKLQDNFDDGNLEPTKWDIFVSGGGSTVESGGVVTVTVPASTINAQSQLTLKASMTIDLESSYVSGKVTPHASSGNTDTAFKIWNVAFTNALFFTINNGTITALKTAASVDTVLSTRAYSPTNDAYLRIRESGGTIYFDTSPDGQAWVNMTSLASFFPVDGVLFIFAAVEFASDAGATSGGTIDNFNIGQSALQGEDDIRPRQFSPGRGR